MLVIKRKLEGIWTDFPEAKGVRLKIRPLAGSKVVEISAKFKRKVPVEHGGRLHFADDMDDAGFGRALFDFALEEWEGVEVEEATTDDQVRDGLYSHDGLRNFVIGKAYDYGQALQSEQEQEEKN